MADDKKVKPIFYVGGKPVFLHTVEPVKISEKAQKYLDEIENLLNYVYAKSFWGIRDKDSDLRLIEAFRLSEKLYDEVVRKDKEKLSEVVV